MIGHLQDLTRTRDGRWRMTVDVRSDEVCELFDKLSGKIVDVGIKQYRERRSLDANAYAWVLIDAIAREQGLTKVEVYREVIRNIGGVSETFCMRTQAVDQFRETWSRNGIGYQTEIMPSKLPNCTNVVAYYGSSTYDSKQMSALIDQLVFEAKALGIETRTPEQLAQMIGDWNGGAA